MYYSIEKSLKQHLFCKEKLSIHLYLSPWIMRELMRQLMFHIHTLLKSFKLVSSTNLVTCC